MKISQTMWWAYVQLVGSLMILVAILLVPVAFFFENKESPERRLLLMTMILGLTGTSLYVLIQVKEK